MSIIDTWLHKIEKTMKNIQKDFMVSLYQEPIDKSYIQHLREEFHESKFTIREIDTFLTNCTTKYVYELDGIKLTIICDKQTKTTSKKIIMSLFRIKTLRAIFEIQNELHIILLPIHMPRIKPGHDEQVQPKHINGAYTYTSDGTIYIYRLEEWPKVVLHEVLHNVPRLQRIQWSEKEIKTLYEVFGIDRKGCPVNCKTVLEPTEAIIETWAIFLHTAFLALERDKDFYKLLDEELEWNDQQTRWILEKQHGRDGKGGRDGLWYEETHTFSYIVLRGILLHNLETFIKMKTPYSGKQLLKLFLKEWRIMKDRIMKMPYKKNNSLRMSKFGDL